MLLKYFYDKHLAHASYLVGCQRSQTALIVDPGRNVVEYLEAADSEGLEIVAVVETHIHADYVSGARELAERLNAMLYVSDEGPDEWKYQYLQPYRHQLLKDGDVFKLGRIQFEVLHTPGHTPESLSFLLTDQGGGADGPMGIFTGDFVFVGSIGRPDLLEEAAGIDGTAEPGARDLFTSIKRFKKLPDYVQVWPAHGAGSACGKGLGAIPSSTVGYEKRFNPALQINDESEFVDYILADQPEAPSYFGRMKQVNKEGPSLLREQTQLLRAAPVEIEYAVNQGTVVDLSPATSFHSKHVPGTLNIPLPMLAAWAGWLVDYERPVYLVANEKQNQDFLEEVLRLLQKIGIDEVAGVFRSEDLARAGKTTESYQNVEPGEGAALVASGAARLIDVRSDAEHQQNYIPQADHRFLGKLRRKLDTLPRDRSVIVHCQGGARSAIAASLLQAAGYDVMNLRGGIEAWIDAGFEVAHASTEPTSCPIV